MLGAVNDRGPTRLCFPLRISRTILLLLLSANCSSEATMASSPITSSTSGLTTVSSFDVYSDGATLHLLVSGTVGEDKTQRVHYSRSDDGGATWADAVRIETGETPPHSPSPANAVQIAAAGEHLIVIWSTAGNGWGGHGPIVTALSADGGKVWRRGANPADHRQPSDQSFVDVVADRSGVFHLVWIDDRAQDQRALFFASSTDYGEHWSRHRMIDALTCDCCPTKITATAEGALYVIYRDRNPRDMRLAHSPDGGVTWQQQGRVGSFDWFFDGCPHVGAGLVALAAHGQTLHATVWTGQEDRRGVYCLTSHDGGQQWTVPIRLGHENAQHSDLAASDATHLMAVWDSVEAGTFTIVTATSKDSGHSWSSPRRLHESAKPVSYPRIVATPFGYRTFWLEHTDTVAWVMTKP